MIEFDVLPEHADGTGRLLLAHDYRDAQPAPGDDPRRSRRAWRTSPPTPTRASSSTSTSSSPGYEARVCAALRAHGLAERALVSTMVRESLPRVRAAAPEVRLGWSVPHVRRDYLGPPAHAAAGARRPASSARRAIPRRAAAELRAGRIDAVMAHWALVTPRFAAAIAAAGGELYVWTVDDAERIAALEALPASRASSRTTPACSPT